MLRMAPFQGADVLTTTRSKIKPHLFLPRAFKRAPPGRGAAPPEDNPAIQEIWHVVGAIPRGQVSTYGSVARAAGLPGRARLAGRALRLVPKTAHLPWHRVVGAGGRIVFPPASLQYREQTRRLLAEKVVVKNGRVNRAFMTTLEER
jgi:methylated-DNA-protein-cysteine methyltransferase related protein